LCTAGAGLADDRPWPFDDGIHAWWVEAGRLLAAEYPGDQDGVRAAEKVGLLVDAGVRTFVDLTEAEELVPYELVVVDAASRRQLDLRYHRFPIPDVGVIVDEGYGPILEHIAASMDRGAVYVHCWGGVGRTGTVIGCHLVDAGVLDADVDARLGELRAGTGKAHRASPETARQRDVIRRRAAARG